MVTIYIYIHIYNIYIHTYIYIHIYINMYVTRLCPHKYQPIIIVEIQTFLPVTCRWPTPCGQQWTPCDCKVAKRMRNRKRRGKTCALEHQCFEQWDEMGFGISKNIQKWDLGQKKVGIQWQILPAGECVFNFIHNQLKPPISLQSMIHVWNLGRFYLQSLIVTGQLLIHFTFYFFFNTIICQHFTRWPKKWSIGTIPAIPWLLCSNMKRINRLIQQLFSW